MNLRDVLSQSETIVGLVHDCKKIVRIPRKRTEPTPTSGRDNRINEYLASNEIKKLHLGAGPSSLVGWLSSDISPESPGAIYLDATEPFPFADHTFDYVYSEHMIEHISWGSGLFMLRECRRVLKPNGRIRIATPDLKVLLGLYDGSDGDIGEKYIQWITDRFLKGVNTYKASFVINNAFHRWGHQFLYDRDLLTLAMREAGFADIEEYAYGESADPNLRDIESHGKIAADDEMVEFETMIFEGRSLATTS
jgi:predicted SAM-dependent methyltransferase